MKERFENLYKLPNNLYVENSPVIIVAGSLLKDTESSNLIIQLKYHSLSDKNIKALKIKLNVYDVTKQLLGEDIEYQYLDLSIFNGQDFGANKAIIVPNSVARSFSIKEFTVIYDNNEQWVSTIPLVQLFNSQSLSTELKDPEVVKQYRLSTNESANYVPKEMYGLWQCACGEWNKHSTCTKCRLSKKKIFVALDVEQLNKDKCARLEREAESAALIKKQQEEEASNRKKTTRKIIIIGASIIILVGLIITFIKTKPIIMMKRAEKEIAKGNYDEAMNMIVKLNNEEMTISISDKILQKIQRDIDKAIGNEDFQLAINIAKENSNFINTSASIKNIQSVCSHNITYNEKKEPTCQESGYDRNICQTCGYCDSNIIEPLRHNYMEEITKNATCIEKGIKIFTCTMCEKTKEEYIDALGHSYREITSKKQTCDLDGEFVYVCDNCGDSYSEKIPANGHNWVNATCTTNGYCSTCGKVGEVATGHMWNSSRSGVVLCSKCSIDYPANVKFLGFPARNKDGSLVIEGMRIDNVYVADRPVEGRLAFLDVTFYGVNNCQDRLFVNIVDFDIYDSKGNDMWMHNAHNDNIYTDEGRFETVYENITVPIDDTYTIVFKDSITGYKFTTN